MLWEWKEREGKRRKERGREERGRKERGKGKREEFRERKGKLEVVGKERERERQSGRKESLLEKPAAYPLQNFP